MHMAKSLTERGAVSMLTVIFLALLLTIITTSFVRLSITEQRQSIDDDLTTRAFYAAESGVEDAKRAIAEFQAGQPVTLNEDVCQPASVVTNGLLSSDLDAEYTCQLIDLSPANFQDDLDPWEAVTIPLSGADPFSSVLIEWHIHEEGQPYDRRANGQQFLPPVGSWNGGNASRTFPAMLRAAVFSHPAGNSFTPGQVQQAAVFINPASTASNTNPFSNDGSIINGGCAPRTPTPGQYACRVTLTNINSSRTNYLRLQALYRATDVQVTLVGTLLEDVQAIVDVTGRAGDVFRRIEARVSLINQEFPFPDIALWSNSDICKDITVTNDVSDYNWGECTWGP